MVVGKAERAYLAAFERLKEGRPEVLPIGTPVSQNNVSQEAGKCASALRLERYPKLAQDIKAYVKAAAASATAAKGSTLKPVPGSREIRAQTQKVQYDLQASKVLSLLLTVADLRKEVAELRLQLDAVKQKPRKGSGS